MKFRRRMPRLGILQLPSQESRKIRTQLAAPVEPLEERLVLDVSAPALLQIFDSSYANIEDRAADIFASGYGGIWLPPLGRADSGNQSVGYDVFNRFDLGVADAPTLYGTETGIKTTVDVLHDAGLDVYVDFVLNHNGFSDLSRPGFVESGGYPGFAITLNPGNNTHGIDDIDGDFNGSFEGGDLDGRLAGLIDIDQAKNYQFIRSPVDPDDPLNLPAGTSNNQPDPNNARFYPDRDLDPIMLFNPITGQSDIPVYPFNTDAPLNGDAVTENALGYLMRNAQWLVQEIGVDGFRLDAVKHFPTYVLEFFDQAVYRSNLRPQLDGSTQHVFSFSEIFDGDKAFQQSKIRKDINPADPGRIGGNRDVLDFPLNFALRDNLTGNGFVNDWRDIKNASQDIQDDGLANNGSQGVAFVNSHDEHGPELSSVAHAFILMRPGNSVVYFNAEEFGQGRDFPKDGRGDALGGQFGDAIATLVNLRNTHGRGDYIDRTPAGDEKETLIFERSASAITILSNRTDGGFDSRTIPTNFLPGTPLVELTGNAANPVIDPFNDFPEVVVVKPDGTIDIRVPRNKAPGDNGVQHNSGYLIYGVAGPQGQLSITNVSSTLPAETATAETNGTARVTDIDVITTDAFDVTLTTSAVNHLGSVRDSFADGDNALIRIDGGIDVNGNDRVDFTTVGNTSYGFEEFVTHKQPGYAASDGNGLYQQTIDATQLAEGQHFIEVQAYRHREPGEGDAVYSSFRQTIYVDRLAPESAVDSFPASVDGVNENRTLNIRSVDLTADNVHVFLNLPAALSDSEVLALVGGESQTRKTDRDLFSKDFDGVTSGHHVATVITYEATGNVNIQRIPGLMVSSILGVGLGDLDADGDIDSTDFFFFEGVLRSHGDQFHPAADFNADGLIDVTDLSLYHQHLLTQTADSATIDAFTLMARFNGNFDWGDAPAHYPTLLSNNGAYHLLEVGPFLGIGVDAENDGHPSPTAIADSGDDGVALPHQLQLGETVCLPIMASGNGLLNAFVDLNQDGDFEDDNEQFAVDTPLISGRNHLSLTIPETAMEGDAIVRFRFSSFAGVTATGMASDGEVEDYQLPIVAGADLTATSFQIASSHVQNGTAAANFRISNMGTVDAGVFTTRIYWSDDDSLDPADTEVMGSAVTFAGLAQGEHAERAVTVQLNRRALYRHASVHSPVGESVGFVSTENGHLFLVVDADSDVAEADESNNAAQGQFDDSDDVTYFPWDIDSNGVVTPVETVKVVQAIGSRDATNADFDGNGIVTPLEALGAIQRIGYVRNNSVITEPVLQTSSTELLVPLYQFPQFTNGRQELAGWWKDIADAATAESPITVIVNPQNGTANPNEPTSDFDVYSDAIQLLAQNPHVTILGYVFTQRGQRNEAELRTNIEFYEHYQSALNENFIDGIFVDEMSASAADVDYYERLATNIRDVSVNLRGKLIVGNTGVLPDAALLSPRSADVLVTFENVEDSTGAGDLAFGDARPPIAETPDIDYAAIVHGVSNGANRDRLIREAKQHGFRYLYVTDDHCPNPFDEQPQFWANMATEIGLPFRSPIPAPAPLTSQASATAAASAATVPTTISQIAVPQITTAETPTTVYSTADQRAGKEDKEGLFPQNQAEDTQPPAIVNDTASNADVDATFAKDTNWLSIL